LRTERWKRRGQSEAEKNNKRRGVCRENLSRQDVRSFIMTRNLTSQWLTRQNWEMPKINWKNGNQREISPQEWKGRTIGLWDPVKNGQVRVDPSDGMT
jgi:hypothetical protein